MGSKTSEATENVLSKKFAEHALVTVGVAFAGAAIGLPVLEGIHYVADGIGSGGADLLFS